MEEVSFSAKVKEEIAREMKPARHCQIAELLGIFMMCGKISIDEEDRFKIRIGTENHLVVHVFMELVKKAFGKTVKEIQFCYKGKRPASYVVLIDDAALAKEILMALKMVDEHGNLGEDLEEKKELITQKSCCKRGFLKGVFLVCGSVSNPQKGYHFEMVFPDETRAVQVKDTLNAFELDAKIVLRKKTFVVYLKEGAKIVDLLNILEAHVALMELENIRILREMRESVNRKVNCETANINKTVSAAVRQIEDISYIKEQKGLEFLPDSLYEIAGLRLSYPESSLKELGERMNPPIGKSGVNHRLRRISEIAEKLRKQ